MRHLVALDQYGSLEAILLSGRVNGPAGEGGIWYRPMVAPGIESLELFIAYPFTVNLKNQMVSVDP